MKAAKGQLSAEVAELVDALVSGTSERTLVGVRISPSAPNDMKKGLSRSGGIGRHARLRI